MSAGVLPRKPCVGSMVSDPSAQRNAARWGSSTEGETLDRQIGRSTSKWLLIRLGKTMITFLLPTLLPLHQETSVSGAGGQSNQCRLRQPVYSSAQGVGGIPCDGFWFNSF